MPSCHSTSYVCVCVSLLNSNRISRKSDVLLLITKIYVYIFNFKSFILALLYISLQVREQVMQRYRIATHQKTYADIIREEAVPDIG